MKEMAEELRMRQAVMDRLKSPEEREIEKFIERRKQEAFKENVKEIRKMDTEQFFLTGIRKDPNIFKNHERILTTGSNVFDRSMFFK